MSVLHMQVFCRKIVFHADYVGDVVLPLRIRVDFFCQCKIET